MTVLQAIQSNPIFGNVSEENINVKLIGRAIDGSAEFSTDTVEDVELVSADLYMELAAYTSFSEGSLAISMDNSALITRANRIYQRYDDEAYSAGTKINVGINAIPN